MNLSLFLATVLIWGTTWIAIAFQLGPVPVLVAVFHRFALAAVLMLPALMLLRRLTPVPLRQHRFILLQGICLFSLNFICFYNATRFIPSGLVSVIFSLATIYNAVNARLIFGERVKPRALLATALGAAGLICLFAPELTGHEVNAEALKGIGLAALGTLFFSLGNMVSRRNSAAGIPPLTANAWGMGYGALILLAIITATGTPLMAPEGGRYLWALIYLSVVGSIIGFTTYLMLVQRIGTGRAAYATVCFPVIALMASARWEGFIWTPLAVAGLALTLAGNAVMFLPQRQR
ncbi:DMT family transporter [Gemmobacter sp.]|uniref:DMT family transporter n=1 Tax=Gemmobacter sp. TaxID=1898957 RepID=UPI0025BA79D9|nr:DMT family transporter [Gemmobacter sp.]